MTHKYLDLNLPESVILELAKWYRSLRQAGVDADQFFVRPQTPR